MTAQMTLVVTARCERRRQRLALRVRINSILSSSLRAIRGLQ
jgi:hypothetical protein